VRAAQPLAVARRECSPAETRAVEKTKAAVRRPVPLRSFFWI